MLSLVALSGAEFAEALERSGFQVAGRRAGLTSLTRGERTVVVADEATLGPDELLYLLRRSGIAYFELLDLLAAGKSKNPAVQQSGFHTRARPGETGRGAADMASHGPSLHELANDARSAREQAEAARASAERALAASRDAAQRRSARIEPDSGALRAVAERLERLEQGLRSATSATDDRLPKKKRGG